MKTRIFTFVSVLLLIALSCSLACSEVASIPFYLDETQVIESNFERVVLPDGQGGWNDVLLYVHFRGISYNADGYELNSIPMADAYNAAKQYIQNLYSISDEVFSHYYISMAYWNHEFPFGKGVWQALVYPQLDTNICFELYVDAVSSEVIFVVLRCEELHLLPNMTQLQTTKR